MQTKQIRRHLLSPGNVSSPKTAATSTLMPIFAIFSISPQLALSILPARYIRLISLYHGVSLALITRCGSIEKSPVPCWRILREIGVARRLASSFRCFGSLVVWVFVGVARLLLGSDTLAFGETASSHREIRSGSRLFRILKWLEVVRVGFGLRMRFLVLTRKPSRLFL